MDKNGQTPPNVLEMIPTRQLEFRQNKDKIELLEPRFKSHFAKKYISRLFKRQHFIIHLDEFGSFVWSQIDSKRTVFEIAAKLEEKFGNDVNPVYERLGLYINMLAQRKYISLQNTSS